MRKLAQLKHEHECEISRVHRWHTFCHHSLLAMHTHTQIHMHVRMSTHTLYCLTLDKTSVMPKCVCCTTLITTCGHLSVKASGAQLWDTAEYMSVQDTFHTHKWGNHIFTNTHSPKPFDWGRAMVGIWKVLGSLVLSERSGSQGFKSSKEKSVLGLEELDGKTFT